MQAMRLTALLAGLTALGAVAPTSAKAEEPFVVPPSPYELGLDFGVVYASVPSINGLGFSVDDFNYDFVRQYGGASAIEGFGPAVSLHLGAPDFGGRGWFDGARVNLDAQAFWVMSNISARANLDDEEYLDLLPVDGGPTFGDLYFDPAQIKSHGEGRFGALDVALTVERSFAHGAGNTSVLVGPRFAYQSQTWDVTTGSSVEDFDFRLNQQVSAWFVGPEVGIRHVQPMGGGAEFNVIARAAALYFDADLDSSQHVLVDGDKVFGLHSRDNDDGFSGRIELGSGFTVPFPNSRALFSLDGSVTWWSAVPQIVNPRSGPGKAANTANFRAAHLATDDMWTAKAVARVTIPLD